VELSTRLLSWPLALALLLAAAAAVAVLYRRDRARLSPRRGRVLTALRLLAVALLAALLGDPVLRRTELALERGAVLVVVDASRSSALRDPPAARGEAEPELRGEAEPGLSRAEAAWRSLASGPLAALEERFEVSTFSLADDLRPAGPAAAASGPPPPRGQGTDLGRPLLEEVSRRPRGAVAGIVLLSDGNHHAPDDPRQAARLLSALGAPIIAVGVGPLEPLPDIALTGVDATGRVFAGDEIAAQVSIEAHGLDAREIPLTVREGEAVVAELVAELVAGGGVTRLPIRFPAGEPGRKRFTVSFPPAPGERTADNNSRDVWVEVLSAKARVLLLDGAPRWEWRYLRSGWTEDPNVELEAFVVTPPPDRRLPQGFPRSPEELFARDVVVLGDVDPALFSREEKEMLRDFVTARGGALVLIAGERALPHRWRDTPLADVLPVELGAEPPGALGKEIARSGVPLALTREGEVSEITRLVPGRERNVELWGLLPQPRWLSPVLGLKPGAEVLVTAARAAAPRLPGYIPPPAGEEGAAAERRLERFLKERGAVYVTGVYGGGRVLYSGIDSSWRWRFRFGDELYRRFWGQVARWGASGRLGADDGHARLGTDRLLYPQGARIRIESMVRDAAGAPFAGDLVDAVITRLPGGASARTRLEPIPRSGGRYRAAADLAALGIAPGAPRVDDGEARSEARGGEGNEEGGAADGGFAEYEVHLEIPQLPGYAALASPAAVRFVVEPALDPERHDLACDRDLLSELAALSGGSFLPLARLGEAPRLLPERTRRVTRSSAMGLLDFPVALAALVVGLLALEWALRKRWELL
jgi:hypothetical protein